MTEPRRCPKCNQPMMGEQGICTQCGEHAQLSRDGRLKMFERARAQRLQHGLEDEAQTGRTAILILAILLGISTAVAQMWFRVKIAEAEATLQKGEGLTAKQISQTRMVLDQARTSLNLSLLLDGTLVICFLGLWVLARHRPLSASFLALLLFLALQGILLLSNPDAFYKGGKYKVIFLLVLIYAILASDKLRKLRAKSAAAAP